MEGQLATDDLGPTLRETVFVVVDLETTGGSPVEGGITEIGAVKIHGGAVIGEFSTLVNPGVPIPAFIASLTGITDALVAGAPPLAAVLPGFLEFMRGAVLVAHNAPYDIGFLKGACAIHEHAWPNPQVLDTARIARLALHREEVRNCKLATLAAHFRTEVVPSHRAFDDARATADVFHALIGRLGDLGVRTLSDLQTFSSRVTREQRAKRHLADGLPDAPGVYVFRDPKGEPLYVGTSKNIRARVRGYFTASETRRRMAEMVGIASEVTPIVCATSVEAHIREIRLIAESQPRYNHRSKRPDRQVWLKLTDEPAPRLSVVREVKDDVGLGARYLGPFPGAGMAHQVAEALTSAFSIRTCTTTLARTPRRTSPACVLAELGRCAAPCQRDHDADAYAREVERVRTAMSGDLREVEAILSARMQELASSDRYEEAAIVRDRLSALARASLRTQRLAMLARTSHLVAAQQTPDGGWEVHCMRHGMLAGAVRIPRGLDPRPVVDAMVAAADQVPAPPPGRLAGLTEEAEVLGTWLRDARLIEVGEPMHLPRTCGGRTAVELSRVHQAMAAVAPVVGDLSWAREGREGRPMGPRHAAVTRMAIG